MDMVWLVSSILTARQMLENSGLWVFGWIIFNSFHWVKREVSQVYKDCMDDEDVVAMIPNLKPYLPIPNRYYWKKNHCNH